MFFTLFEERKRMKRITFLIIALAAISICVSAEETQKGWKNMRVSSPVFAHNQFIPKKYTCDGEDVNPAFEIQDIPANTRSITLIVDDPDAPMGTWVHWVVYDIAVSARIDENSIPGKQGSNDFGRLAYGGPCPPSGTHRYFFKLYALDKKLGLSEGINKQGVEKAMQGHILAKSELIGLYKRK